jgi:hypothetical protein
MLQIGQVQFDDWETISLQPILVTCGAVRLQWGNLMAVLSKSKILTYLAAWRRPMDVIELQWANSMLGNFKTRLTGRYHIFGFDKCVQQYLIAFAYRFNICGYIFRPCGVHPSSKSQRADSLPTPGIPPALGRGGLFVDLTFRRGPNACLLSAIAVLDASVYSEHCCQSRFGRITDATAYKLHKRVVCELVRNKVHKY